RLAQLEPPMPKRPLSCAMQRRTTTPSPKMPRPPPELFWNVQSCTVQCSVVMTAALWLPDSELLAPVKVKPEMTMLEAPAAATRALKFPEASMVTAPVFSAQRTMGAVGDPARVTVMDSW